VVFVAHPERESLCTPRGCPSGDGGQQATPDARTTNDRVDPHATDLHRAAVVGEKAVDDTDESIQLCRHKRRHRVAGSRLPGAFAPEVLVRTRLTSQVFCKVICVRESVKSHLAESDVFVRANEPYEGRWIDQVSGIGSIGRTCSALGALRVHCGALAQGGVTAYEPRYAPTTTTAQKAATTRLATSAASPSRRSRRLDPAASAVIASPNPTRQATTLTTSPGPGLPLLHCAKAMSAPATASAADAIEKYATRRTSISQMVVAEAPASTASSDVIPAHWPKLMMSRLLVRQGYRNLNG